MFSEVQATKHCHTKKLQNFQHFGDSRNFGSIMVLREFSTRTLAQGRHGFQATARTRLPCYSTRCESPQTPTTNPKTQLRVLDFWQSLTMFCEVQAASHGNAQTIPTVWRLSTSPAIDARMLEFLDVLSFEHYGVLCLSGSKPGKAQQVSKKYTFGDFRQPLSSRYQESGFVEFFEQFRVMLENFKVGNSGSF